MTKIKAGDVALIKWRDHYSRNCGWRGLAEVRKISKDIYYCYSVGVIISIDKKQVVLAQNWHKPMKKGWESQVSDFMVIMINCIEESILVKKKAL